MAATTRTPYRIAEDTAEDMEGYRSSCWPGAPAAVAEGIRAEATGRTVRSDRRLVPRADHRDRNA
ncbi:hypothetical protein GCM10010394_15360 [Streptomyces crystallinus]|uniref:Uncharacterized protein n=1 Tax=Streptomyces crystallinus TaxID=68191 RepID=A0ABN1FBY3_9ACTN